MTTSTDGGGMRIFGVGLNKTGTTSMSQACSVLGFRSMHWRGLGLRAKTINARVDKAIERHQHPFRYAARLRYFQAYFDMRSVERNFEYFDEFCPGSKFILHTRELESWLDSRERHVQGNAETGRSGWTTVDRDAWATLWHEHHDRVTTYFADRPGDLLVMNLAAGDGWEQLCPFLGVPVPDRPFPVANRAAPPSPPPPSSPSSPPPA